VYSEKTPDDGERNCPKHVEFLSNNKFEKLVHLVGFIIRNTPTIFVKLLPHPHKESFSVCNMRPTVATLMDVTVGIFILFPFPE
jgi:hypothetical protein